MGDSRPGSADELDFYEGDRIAECQVLRRSDGDRHCIVALFIVRRESGGLDIYVAGTGPLRWRPGVTADFVRAFMADMKRTMGQDAPHPVEWQTVAFNGCSSAQEDIAALQRAGVQVWM